ncbi:hypothetical protein ASE01_04275 [Nocardioides sp. Root190]|uniref:hypothetical protein n=1 Tax=Nocardioides sp. Root190 TaxID=1736488 RepID=UPI0006F90C2D|nr:hypothetical protein [Nocardioides sp. Root190]KRB78485.1 hypothetical protein ASE01_04275 [Nocardioides sp. Root190]
MSENTPEPSDTQSQAAAAADASEPSPEKPFNVDDLMNGPDDVVHNSDAPRPDEESDPAKDDGASDWTDEGGATSDGPATDTDAGDADPQ